MRQVMPHRNNIDMRRTQLQDLFSLRGEAAR